MRLCVLWIHMSSLIFISKLGILHVFPMVKHKFYWPSIRACIRDANAAVSPSGSLLSLSAIANFVSLCEDDCRPFAGLVALMVSCAELLINRLSQIAKTCEFGDKRLAAINVYAHFGYQLKYYTLGQLCLCTQLCGVKLHTHLHTLTVQHWCLGELISYHALLGVWFL